MDKLKKLESEIKSLKYQVDEFKKREDELARYSQLIEIFNKDTIKKLQELKETGECISNFKTFNKENIELKIEVLNLKYQIRQLNELLEIQTTSSNFEEYKSFDKNN